MGKLMRKVIAKSGIIIVYRMDLFLIYVNFTVDIFWNLASCRVRTLDGKILVCTHGDLFGIHCVQRRFQSKIRGIIHSFTVSKMFPLAS